MPEQWDPKWSRIGIVGPQSPWPRPKQAPEEKGMSMTEAMSRVLRAGGEVKLSGEKTTVNMPTNLFGKGMGMAMDAETAKAGVGEVPTQTGDSRRNTYLAYILGSVAKQVGPEGSIGRGLGEGVTKSIEKEYERGTKMMTQALANQGAQKTAQIRAETAKLSKMDPLERFTQQELIKAKMQGYKYFAGNEWQVKLDQDMKNSENDLLRYYGDPERYKWEKNRLLETKINTLIEASGGRVVNSDVEGTSLVYDVVFRDGRSLTVRYNRGE